MRDLIEIVDPELGLEEASRLEAQLGIGGGDLPAPGSDESVELGGFVYHLVADADAVFLVAVLDGDPLWHLVGIGRRALDKGATAIS